MALRLARVLGQNVRVRFTRYTVASLVATGISQLVLFVLYGWGVFGALVASTVAFAVGAVPHFVMIRWWAWGQRGMPRLTRQVVGYLVVTVLGGLVSVLLTAAADWLVGPLVADRAARTLVLNVTYVLSGLPVFVAKYAFLDRVFGQDAYEETNSTSVRAANPVAPGTTSA
ncbi:GtrA-like protein [Actinokineospora diospyrosa]|uniref:GtrA-like protein n=1 Tax=Actinokineospora diospyrosa TaxID=103728 RepID=A0ABT1ILF1_9PSEU|nr:GtrA-like protein [Actinokineospora diospyrosa]